MTDKRTIDGIDSGEKKVVSKWEYLLNYWTPIIAIIAFFVSIIFWFANIEGRVFTNQEMKILTESSVRSGTERFVTKQEFDEKLSEYLEIVRENRQDIKEILKYLRK